MGLNVAQHREGSSAWPQMGKGSVATYDNPLASLHDGSSEVILLLSESDLNPSSKYLGLLVLSTANNEIFNMVGGWWWLRVKACNSLERWSPMGFSPRETKAAEAEKLAPNSWAGSVAGEDDVDYRPRLALRTYRESHLKDGPQCPLWLATHRTCLDFQLLPVQPLVL